jgi:hypothetical protein
MKLIPRRKKNQPTTFERVTGFVKLGVKGLAVQRLARKAFRRYKFTKRAVPLAGLAAIGAVVLKKLRGGGASSTPSYSAGASAGAASGQSAATSAAAAATAATGTPPATNGATAGPDVSDALDDAGVEGSGPDTPKEAAAPGVGDESGTTGSGAGEASDDATEASPPADASGTEEGLEIEGPNQSTPPPPKAAKKK